MIVPAVNEGRIVICDRFVDSSIAYQAYGRQMGETIELLNSFAVGECLPDITFLLRIEPENTRSRMEGRELDRIEMASDDFHYRTFLGYDQIAAANPDRVVVIDGRDSVEHIHELIMINLQRLDEFDGIR